ncbi:APC family permease [Actinomadura madurae]|nr:APC family permease [Actinomadura madurae]MCP9972208.1 APC family permease [Actinomadura madurae]
MTQHTPNTRATAQESRPAVGLDQAALGTPEVVFQAISHLGPAIGVIIVAPVIAGLVGASMPLLMLLAMAAVLLTGAGVAMLAAKLPSAGGYYSYVSHGLGKRSGFVTSWAYFLYDPLIPTLLILITSGILQPAIKSGWGIDIPWWLIMTVLMTLVYVMTLRGVKLSANVTMALGAAECVIMVVFGIWTMIHTGGAAFAAGPFEWPDTGGDLHPVFLAFAFGVLLFTGFESAAPLAEETRDPRRAIPRTVLVSIVVVGLVWAFSGYSAVVGWEGDIAAMGTGDNPFFVIADDLAGLGVDRAGPGTAELGDRGRPRRAERRGARAVRARTRERPPGRARPGAPHLPHARPGPHPDLRPQPRPVVRAGRVARTGGRVLVHRSLRDPRCDRPLRDGQHRRGPALPDPLPGGVQPAQARARPAARLGGAGGRALLLPRAVAGLAAQPRGDHRRLLALPRRPARLRPRQDQARRARPGGTADVQRRYGRGR